DVMHIPFADLVVNSVSAPVDGSGGVSGGGSSGQPLRVSWRVDNVGIGATNTSTWDDVLRLTTDAAGANVIATLGSFAHNGVLPVGGSYTRTADLILPNGIS